MPVRFQGVLGEDEKLDSLSEEIVELIERKLGGLSGPRAEMSSENLSKARGKSRL